MNASLRKAVFSALMLALVGSRIVLAQDYKVYFLEEDKNFPILDLFDEASETMYVVAYVITNEALARGIVEARSRRVDVKVLLDERQVHGNKFSQHWLLEDGGVEVRVTGEETGRLVSDFGIVDERIVYIGGRLLHSDLEANPKVGSYLLFQNDEQILEIYRDEFFKLWERAHY